MICGSVCLDMRVVKMEKESEAGLSRATLSLYTRIMNGYDKTHEYTLKIDACKYMNKI